MNDYTIKTDNKWKQMKYRHEVPKKVLESDFSHLTEDEGHYDGFIKYRNRWYHLSYFMKASNIDDWHGFAGDIFFSGVVIKLHSDGESYKIGLYLC
jgi:hypothetical protein